MTSSKPVTVRLDKERIIVYDNRAEFRMGSLDRPFVFADLRVKRRSWAALVAWIWACLSEKDAADFPSPESLAGLLREPATVEEALGKLIETYVAGNSEESKNGVG